MRTQSGTTSLRAILYMDEIFGFFPPVSNPPSKPPLLALLKQARAFGLGILLATQNPVDLDYKGLSNCGTWFLGRLQTERDKERVLEGLEGASANFSTQFDRQKMSEILAGLKTRVFLMNNVHEDSPVLFETRWCLSYLRGPLTRDQIKKLMDPKKVAQPVKKSSAPVRRANKRKSFKRKTCNPTRNSAALSTDSRSPAFRCFHPLQALCLWLCKSFLSGWKNGSRSGTRDFTRSSIE